MARAQVLEVADAADEMTDDDLLPGEAEAATDEAPEDARAADRATFGRLMDTSAYESRNPTFTAGGTAYVRTLCPECAEPQFFAVETDAEFSNKGGERRLRPTFKVKAKPHACHQVVAELTVSDDPTLPLPAPGPCPCSECVGGCDGESEDGIERCTPCRTGQHVTEDGA